MSESYKESINKIYLSEEMKKSIIKNTSKAAKKKVKTHNIVYLRRIAGFAACLTVCLLSYYIATDYGYMPTDITYPGISTSVPKDESTENTGINTPKYQNDGSDNTTEIIQPVPNNNVVTKDSTAKNHSRQTEWGVSGNTTIDNGGNSVSDSINVDTPQTVSPGEDIIQGIPGVAGGIPNEGTEEDSNTVKSENPIQDLLNKGQIEKELGYSIKIPNHIPNGYKQSNMCVIAGTIAQITYEGESDIIRYRTAKSIEDISGDYTAYNKIEKVKINNWDVVLKGEDSTYYNASWSDNENLYSVSSSNGLDKETMLSIAEYVK